MSEDSAEVSLQKQLDGTQHILGHVLKAVGEPVHVPKTELDESLGGKWIIEMKETETDFVFELTEVEASGL